MFIYFIAGEEVVVEGIGEDMFFFEGEDGDDFLKMEEVDWFFLFWKFLIRVVICFLKVILLL